MEHGRIVKFYKSYDGAPYITIKYREKFLFLNISSFNRRDEFKTTINDEYKDLELNILDLSILEIVKQNIEEKDIEQTDIDEFEIGMIIKSKLSHNYYGVIAASYEENPTDEDIECLLVNLKTFKIERLPVDNWNNQMQYLKVNYKYVMNFKELKINIKE